jgi:hypothetical protein
MDRELRQREHEMAILAMRAGIALALRFGWVR